MEHVNPVHADSVKLTRRSVLGRSSSDVSFCKHGHAEKPPARKIGVPGHPTYDYNSIYTIFSFFGTSFQAVFTNAVFW